MKQLKPTPPFSFFRVALLTVFFGALALPPVARGASLDPGDIEELRDVYDVLHGQTVTLKAKCSGPLAIRGVGASCTFYASDLRKRLSVFISDYLAPMGSNSSLPFAERNQILRLLAAATALEREVGTLADSGPEAVELVASSIR